MNRLCIFSPCRKYRYTLWREWNADLFQRGHYLMVIGLNPSTADETKDDPTIRRCIGFAKRWGFGALCMTNLFAWRDTLPAKMRKAIYPIGPENDDFLRDIATGAGMVIAAWGKNGSFQKRSEIVKALLSDVKLHCLRRNSDGSPEHPLYVPADTIPVPYEQTIQADKEAIDRWKPA